MSETYQLKYDGWWFPSVHVELDRRLTWTFGARFSLASEARVRITDKEAISVMKSKGLDTVAASRKIELGLNYVEGRWGEIKKLLTNISGTLPPPSIKNGFPIEVTKECWSFPEVSTVRGFATLAKINPLISECLDLREKQKQKCLA